MFDFLFFTKTELNNFILSYSNNFSELIDFIPENIDFSIIHENEKNILDKAVKGNEIYAPIIGPVADLVRNWEIKLKNFRI